MLRTNRLDLEEDLDFFVNPGWIIFGLYTISEWGIKSLCAKYLKK